MVVIAISFFVEVNARGQSTSDAMAAEATNAAAEQRADRLLFVAPKTDVMNRHSRTLVTRNDQQRNQSAADTTEAARVKRAAKLAHQKAGQARN